MTTIETIKAQIIPDGRMNWSFVPQPEEVRGYPSFFYPSLETVRVTAEVIVDALYLAGEKELSERVLRQTLYYLVGRSQSFHRESQHVAFGWPSSSHAYAEQYGYAPHCCCGWQRTISYVAATLGYERLRHEAVGLQCPGSPEGYYPEVGQGEPVKSRLNVARRKFIEEHLLALSKGEVDFFKNNRRKPKR
jgi:hypothetical protein